MYRINKKGPSPEPYTMLRVIASLLDLLSLMTTVRVLSVKKFIIQLQIAGGKYNTFNFLIKIINKTDGVKGFTEVYK